jgi:hypothetical protein
VATAGCLSRDYGHPPRFHPPLSSPVLTPREKCLQLAKADAVPRFDAVRTGEPGVRPKTKAGARAGPPVRASAMQCPGGESIASIERQRAPCGGSQRRRPFRVHLRAHSGRRGVRWRKCRADPPPIGRVRGAAIDRSSEALQGADTGLSLPSPTEMALPRIENLRYQQRSDPSVGHVQEKFR